ncbi:MAG: DNA-directed RNA polymerase subunit alpha C-terminal domain-containing protein [Oscillospiraceae bacterium]
MTTDTYPNNLLYDLFDRDWEYPRPADFDGSLEYVLHTLTEREQRIMGFRYKDSLIFEEIGKRECVTRERIRQICAKSLRKLRHPDRLDFLKYGVSGVIRREAESARAAALASLPNPDIPESDIPIEELELSVRSYNCLKRSGMDTLRELSEMTFEDLCHVRNLGKRSIDEICAMLTRHGLSLKTGGDSDDR